MNKLEWQFENPVLKTFKPSFPLPLNIQFFAIDPQLYSFGLADISVFEGDEPLVIDGKDFLQADGGEINLTPSFRNITFKDTGDTIVQRRLAGWEGTVTFVVGQEDLRLMKLALSAVVEITDAATPTVVTGLTDAKMGSVLEGYKVVIHPRVLPSTNKKFDYTIYQMASTGGIVRSYNDEQTNYTITLNMMPRVGFDASKEGNFFFTGETDPNAA